MQEFRITVIGKMNWSKYHRTCYPTATHLSHWRFRELCLKGEHECVRVCVCVHANLNVHMYACRLCLTVHMYACHVCLCVYLFICVCAHNCMCIHMCACHNLSVNTLNQSNSISSSSGWDDRLGWASAWAVMFWRHCDQIPSSQASHLQAQGRLLRFAEARLVRTTIHVSPWLSPVSQQECRWWDV